MDWNFSSRLQQKILSPYCQGRLHHNVNDDTMLLKQIEKSEKDFRVRLFWLIDLLDGTVVDARFQAYGPPALIGALEGACEMAIGKTHVIASRLNSEAIDEFLQDKNKEPAFPSSAKDILKFVVKINRELGDLCKDIAIPNAKQTPLNIDLQEGDIAHPDWLQYSKQHQMSLIEEIVAKEIRPYIELDEGGVEIIEIKEGINIYINYQGACTSCYSATGATLNSIQQILRAKLNPLITVIPKF